MAKVVRNVLFMAFVFPPLAGPSSRHNLSTVRRLREHGWSPTVVTAPEVVVTERRFRSIPSAEHWPQDDYLRSRIPKDVSVVRCPWPFEYRRIFPDIAYALRFPIQPYFFRRGRQRIYDVSHRALKAGNYDLIYSVNGIGVEHSAALELKRSTGLPWVAEFRDPWIHNCSEWQQMRDRSWRRWYSYQFERVRSLEREIVDNADLVVVESPLHAEYLIKDFKLDARKVVPFGLGYEPAFLSDAAEAEPLVAFPSRPVIGFVGRIYYGYQSVIKKLIDALKVLELQGYQFTLVSVGGDNIFHAFASEAKLRSYVPIGKVDYSLAISTMNALDFGIVATSDEYLLHTNSKLYEYLALNLSILAVVPQGGTADSIITEGNCGYVLPYEMEPMLHVLKTALHDFADKNVNRASSEFIQRYSRQTIVAQLTERLEDLV